MLEKFNILFYFSWVNRYQLFAIFAILSSNFALSQTVPNFKPFIKNLEFAKVNEGSVKDLLDTTLKEFLLVANDSVSDVHKNIQREFEIARSTDSRQSYTYPRRLKKNHITIHFLSCSQESGILSEDSVWRSETLDALISIPVMYEDQHGESIINLCFFTELSIYVQSKTDGEQKEKPRTTLRIKKIDLNELWLKNN